MLWVERGVGFFFDKGLYRKLRKMRLYFLLNILETVVALD